MRPLLLALPLAAIAAPAAASPEVEVDVGVAIDVTVRTPDTPPPVESPGEAAVDPVVVVDAAAPAVEAPLDGRRWEALLGMEITPERSIGPIDAWGMLGVHAAVARQHGPWRLAAEYGFASFEGSKDLFDGDGSWMGWEDCEGQVHRIGASLRYRVGLHLPGGSIGASIGTYLEGGVGRQEIRVGGAAPVRRGDVLAGVGFEAAFGGDRIAGFDVAFRITGAPAITGDDARLVVARDAPYDVGFSFVLGMLLGR